MTGRHPRAVGTYGPAIERWALARPTMHPRALKGLRWWQQLALSRAFEHDAAGASCGAPSYCPHPGRSARAARTGGVSWRQHRANFGGPQDVLHVAHKLQAAQEVWRPAARWAVGEYGRRRCGGRTANSKSSYPRRVAVANTGGDRRGGGVVHVVDGARRRGVGGGPTGRRRWYRPDYGGGGATATVAGVDGEHDDVATSCGTIGRWRWRSKRPPTTGRYPARVVGAAGPRPRYRRPGRCGGWRRLIRTTAGRRVVARSSAGKCPRPSSGNNGSTSGFDVPTDPAVRPGPVAGGGLGGVLTVGAGRVRGRHRRRPYHAVIVAYAGGWPRSSSRATGRRGSPARLLELVERWAPWLSGRRVRAGGDGGRSTGRHGRGAPARGADRPPDGGGVRGRHMTR